MALEKENIFFSSDEIQNPIKREKKLFSNISDRLNDIVDKSEGWRNILSKKDLPNIKSKKDLKYLPITRKSSLVEIQAKNPPYGKLNLKSANEFPFMFASPGPIYEPGDEGDFWNMQRSLFAAGFRKGDTVYNTFSYHLGPGGMMLNNAANCLGCSVIPGGIGNTELQVATIEELKPSFYIGTPSFLKIILDKFKEQNKKTSFFKNALVGAEPFPKDLRSYFFQRYEMRPLQMYGTAEVGCIAYETLDKNNNLSPGMIVEENIILEIVRPGSLEEAPTGEVGEVVITKLNSNYPMIRLATGDLSAILEGPSPCGRTNTRIKGWMGRAEQSTKIKGLFITPRQINKIVQAFKEISKVRLVIERKELADYPTLLCEIKGINQSIEENVNNFIKREFKLNINISLVKNGTIPNDGIVIEDKRDND